MKKELIIKKCQKCGAIVHVINDCKCEESTISCCGTEMQTIKANSTDAAIEKHVPNYELKENKLYVSVNHVMDEDHFIEWLCLFTNDKEEYIKLRPNQEAEAIFENVQQGTLYSYCNKHGLWKTEIK